MMSRAARRFLSSSASQSGVPSRSAITVENCGTLHELGRMAGREFGARRSVGFRDAASGEWRWTTFAERLEKARRCSALLGELGVRRGDRVAVISKNREEWVTGAYGSYGAGAVYVPCYEQQLPSDWEYILKDSGASVLLVSRLDLLEPAVEAARGSNVAHVLCFDAEPGSQHSFTDALARQTLAADDDKGEAPCSGSDLATLIYTSGTTGKPKGVELSHAAMVWNSITMKDLSIANLDRLEAGERPERLKSLSILPWGHIFGQTCELHCLTALGCEMALATDATTFLDDAAQVKPTLLIAVPALYNRIYDGFLKSKEELSPFKSRLADRALELGDKKAKSRLVDASGRRVHEPLTWFERAQHALLDRMVLSKVRDKLGGECRSLCSGGAAISSEVRRFVEATGMRLTNGYGLTETSPVLTTENILDAENRLPGSIGALLPSVRVRVVAEDGAEVAAGEAGELVVSTPGLMRGYWNRPDATAEVIFEEDDGARWFRTGDQGVLSEDGKHARIVGRIKEKYKLANGKYVVPTPIEEGFARSRFVSQVFLYGDNQPYNVALVAPDWVAVDEHLNGRNAARAKMTKPFEFGPKHVIDDILANHTDALVDLIRAELESPQRLQELRVPRQVDHRHRRFHCRPPHAHPENEHQAEQGLRTTSKRYRRPLHLGRHHRAPHRRHRLARRPRPVQRHHAAVLT